MASGMARSHRGVAGTALPDEPSMAVRMGGWTAGILYAMLVDGRPRRKPLAGRRRGAHKGSYGTARTMTPPTPPPPPARQAAERTVEFFTAQIRNPHTRAAYAAAVTRFITARRRERGPLCCGLHDVAQCRSWRRPGRRPLPEPTFGPGTGLPSSALTVPARRSYT